MRHVAAVGARTLGVAGVLLIALLMVPGSAGASSLTAAGSATNLTVKAVDNIYGAGLKTAPDPGGAGGGDVPLKVPIPSGTTWITFSDVSGIVFNTAGASNGPDGRAGETGITPDGSLSGITDSTLSFFMVGVFLDGAQPSVATTPPSTLDFSSNESFSSLSPQLDQVFFVGDGVTGTGSGDEQYFQVPAGATDVYLGFADGSAFNGPTGTYNDNSGSLSAAVNFFTGQYSAPSSTLTTASSTSATINATDNVFGAGLATPPAPAGDGAGTPPLDVPIPSGTTWLSFSDVTGAVNSIPGDPNGPDGLDQPTDVTPVGGISGLVDSTGAYYLTGVYFDKPQTGSNATPPPSLNFSNDHSFASLSPQLDQVFFIGDGLTGTGTGTEQYFQVPAGATDLYLGFVDAYSFEGAPGTYSNDSGSLSATVNFLTGQYSAASSTGTALGGLDVAAYCQSVDHTTAELVKGGVTGTNYAYDNWECSGTGTLVTMTDVCRWQYPNANDPVAETNDANSAYSWQCYAGGSLKRHGAGRGNANLVEDGGFEQPVVSGGFQTFAGGSTMGPWTVTGNSVDLVTTGYLASHGGSQEVDLSGSNYNGPGNGGLSQNLATTPGESYVLTYWEGGNDRGSPTVKGLTVSFGGHQVASTSYTDGSSPTYVEYSFTVVATSTHSRLVFTSLDTTNWGALLDDVSVRPGVAATGKGDVAPIAASIGTPGQVFHNMGHNLVNAAITVVAILFITFPSVIFNQTFSSNYAEILLMVANFRRRVRKAVGLKDRPAGLGPEPGSASVASVAPANAATEVADGAPAGVAQDPGRSSRPWFYGVLLAGAVLGGLLNPSFGFNERSLADIGATLVSFALGTIIGWFIAKTFREHHHYPTHTYLHALPLGLAVAALCVLVSRLTNFEPGYLYGVVVSIAFVETLEERHNAHLTAISTLSTLGVALIAWFLWVPVNHFALEHSHDVFLAIIDDVLASIFIGGLVGTVIGLLPLEFMPGGTLAKWRKDVWAVVFFVAIFLLVEVELRPAAGPTHPGGAPIVTALVLFAIFGGGTFWMRHYFATRKARQSALAEFAQASAAAPDGDGADGATDGS